MLTYIIDKLKSFKIEFQMRRAERAEGKRLKKLERQDNFFKQCLKKYVKKIIPIGIINIFEFIGYFELDELPQIQKYKENKYMAQVRFFDWVKTYSVSISGICAFIFIFMPYLWILFLFLFIYKKLVLYLFLIFDIIFLDLNSIKIVSNCYSFIRNILKFILYKLGFSYIPAYFLKFIEFCLKLFKFSFGLALLTNFLEKFIKFIFKIIKGVLKIYLNPREIIFYKIGVKIKKKVRIFLYYFKIFFRKIILKSESIYWKFEKPVSYGYWRIYGFCFVYVRAIKYLKNILYEHLGISYVLFRFVLKYIYIRLKGGFTYIYGSIRIFFGGIFFYFRSEASLKNENKKIFKLSQEIMNSLDEITKIFKENNIDDNIKNKKEDGTINLKYYRNQNNDLLRIENINKYMIKKSQVRERLDAILMKREQLKQIELQCQVEFIDTKKDVKDSVSRVNNAFYEQEITKLKMEIKNKIKVKLQEKKNVEENDKIKIEVRPRRRFELNTETIVKLQNKIKLKLKTQMKLESQNEVINRMNIDMKELEKRINDKSAIMSPNKVQDFLDRLKLKKKIEENDKIKCK